MISANYRDSKKKERGQNDESKKKKPKRKNFGRDQYEIDRKIPTIQERAMHNVSLYDNSILTQTIQEWDHTICRFLLDRMATEPGL